MEFEGVKPDLHPHAHIARGAVVVGKVTMKEFSSVWHNAVVRGDVNRIEIGRYSNVQDLSVVHVADDFPTVIGDYVTVGHHCTLHACTIGDHCLIGMGAIILTGAVIGEGSIVAAGAVVRENQVVPPASLVAGLPAKVLRQIPEQYSQIHAQAVKYKTLWTKRYGLLPEADGEVYDGEQIV